MAAGSGLGVVVRVGAEDTELEDDERPPVEDVKFEDDEGKVSDPEEVTVEVFAGAGPNEV